MNLEQNHKRWEERRELIAAQLKDLRPDIWALNEIHVPSRAGLWLQKTAVNVTGTQYALLQQSKVGEDSRTEAEGLLTRFPVVDTANLDYRSHNCVALVARFAIEGVLLDVYVTHLIAARVDESAREHQASELLKWIRTRDDADCSVVCGDFNAAPDKPSIRLMSASLPLHANAADGVHAIKRIRRRADSSGVAAIRSLYRLHLDITIDQSESYRTLL